jgi:hypothetical protein
VQPVERATLGGLSTSEGESEGHNVRVRMQGERRHDLQAVERVAEEVGQHLGGRSAREEAREHLTPQGADRNSTAHGNNIGFITLHNIITHHTKHWVRGPVASTAHAESVACTVKRAAMTSIKEATSLNLPSSSPENSYLPRHQGVAGYPWAWRGPMEGFDRGNHVGSHGGGPMEGSGCDGLLGCARGHSGGSHGREGLRCIYLGATGVPSLFIDLRE